MSSGTPIFSIPTGEILLTRKYQLRVEGSPQLCVICLLQYLSFLTFLAITETTA